MLNEGERAVFYRSVARLLDAGLPPDTLYSSLAKGFRSERLTALIETCRATALDGRPLSEALRAAAPDIPPLHALAVGAAETTGQVPPTLRELADGDDERLLARKDLLRRAAYPVFLVHLAILGPNAGLLVQDPAAFLAAVLPIILVVDALLLLVWRSIRRPPDGRVGRMLLEVPMLGELLRASSYRGYFRALGYLYEAGVPLPRAARDATETIAQPQLREAVELALAPVDRQEPLSLALPAFPGLKDEVLALLTTSEPVGELGSALSGAAKLYAETESELRARVTKTAAAAVYVGAVLYIAVRVLGFWSEYYGRFFDL